LKSLIINNLLEPMDEFLEQKFESFL